MDEVSDSSINKAKIINYEANWLTEEKRITGQVAIQAIKAEFDFIVMCQGMIKPFGFEARELLDRLIALSLRKLLCDEKSLLLKLCPDFQMPPLVGDRFDCPGDDGDLMIVEIHPDLNILPQSEWIPLKDWLQERIAWIEKGAEDLPDAYTDWFYGLLIEKLGKRKLDPFFTKEQTEEGVIIWTMKNLEVNKLLVYELLKKNGYYDLSIKRMIKHIADKQGAHIDKSRSMWIGIANAGKVMGYSAISTFATQMIYAATKQVKALSDYFPIKMNLETLSGNKGAEKEND